MRHKKEKNHSTLFNAFYYSFATTTERGDVTRENIYNCVQYMYIYTNYFAKKKKTFNKLLVNCVDKKISMAVVLLCNGYTTSDIGCRAYCRNYIHGIIVVHSEL